MNHLNLPMFSDGEPTSQANERQSRINRADNVKSKGLTDNVYIDGLLSGGDRFATKKLSYSFWNQAALSNRYDSDSQSDKAWTDDEKVAMEAALKTWSDVANLQFIPSDDDASDASLGFTLVDDSDRGVDYLGAAYVPGDRAAGLSYFNRDGEGWNSTGLGQGGYGFVTLIHELGHVLGLEHPHDRAPGSPKYPGVKGSDSTGDFDLNQGIWTTMSYNDGWLTEDEDALFDVTDYGYQGTPMAFDIAAIQHLYGANMTHNTGDDVYQVPTGNESGTFYASIWDAGGTDTISAKGARSRTTINLNEAPLVGPNAGGYVSKARKIFGGFTIANGVEIENAIGGRKGDKLMGNGVANVLNGKAGRDRIDGQAGDDTLLGMAGNDRLNGGTGDDLLEGGAGSDVMSGGVGADTFVITTQRGDDLIQDFELGVDRLGLGSGLAADALSIFQENQGAVVALGGDRLAVLAGIQSDQLDSGAFVSV